MIILRLRAIIFAFLIICLLSFFKRPFCGSLLIDVAIYFFAKRFNVNDAFLAL